MMQPKTPVGGSQALLQPCSRGAVTCDTTPGIKLPAKRCATTRPETPYRGHRDTLPERGTIRCGRPISLDGFGVGHAAPEGAALGQASGVTAGRMSPRAATAPPPESLPPFDLS